MNYSRDQDLNENLNTQYPYQSIDKNQTALAKILDTQVTTLVVCWHLKLKNGKEYGFTNHEDMLYIDGVEYLAKSGFTASAITTDSNMAVDSLDIEGIIDNELIKEEDIFTGIYDHAEIKVFIVDYTKPNVAKIKMRRGWLGEVSIYQGRFVVEVRGMLQAFTNNIGNIYSSNCRANFGDLQCKANLNQYIINNCFVEKIDNMRLSFIFNDTNINNDTNNILSNRKTSDNFIFKYGIIEFKTGNNSGIKMEIAEHNAHYIKLAVPAPYEIIIGDIFFMIAGCDKQFQTCCNIYNNGVNFRGEPHIPTSRKFTIKN